MATYDGSSGSVHKTLSAGVADTVAFGRDAQNVEVLIRSSTTADPVYFTVDGPAPTVEGDGTQVVMVGSALIAASTSGQLSTVRLISAAPAKYSTRTL